LLGRGNQKLGPHIHSWSLPAIHSCPGRSHVCERVCYGRRARFTLPAISNRLSANMGAVRASDFVERMCREIRKCWAQVVRVHVVGDFFSRRYVSAWTEIARRCAKTEFFGYTRSWRCPGFLPGLLELDACQNFQLFGSCDRETGVPDNRLRSVYMAASDQDVPPSEVGLVFRVKRRTRLKRLAGVLVCPAENGVSSITCTQCRLCWRDRQWWQDRLCQRH